MRPGLALLALVLSNCSNGEPPTRTTGLAGRQACLLVPTELEFGLVGTGGVGVQSLVLENPSDDVVIFATLGTTEPPFRISDARVAVLPRSRKGVQVTFTPFDGRTQIARVAVSSEGCEDRLVELRGVGEGDVLVPPVVVSPPTPLGTTVEIAVPVTNGRRSAITLAVTQVFGSDAFSFPSTLQVPGSSSANLLLTFDARQIGPASVALELRAGTLTRRCTVSASGGLPRARVEQSRLVIDPLPRDLTVDNTRHLAIFNDGAGPLNLTALRVRPAPGTEPLSLSASLATELVQPGGATTVALRFLSTTPGLSQWTVELDTDDPMTPVVRLEIEANLADVPSCAAPVRVNPTQVDVVGPYPVEIPFDFTNPTASPCLVDNLHFDPLGGATTDLGVADGFVIPGGATVRRVATLNSSGNRGLAFRTWPTPETYLFIRASD